MPVVTTEGSVSKSGVADHAAADLGEAWAVGFLVKLHMSNAISSVKNAQKYLERIKSPEYQKLGKVLLGDVPLEAADPEVRALYRRLVKSGRIVGARGAKQSRFAQASRSSVGRKED